ncbi:hypothetical protein LXA43DRAFT_1098171 [Ganoderma leucocontextum]|nr:hypothetical protein LXA43DRAFT_1098171 [Ganoderma leucocontextum]
MLRSPTSLIELHGLAHQGLRRQPLYLFEAEEDASTAGFRRSRVLSSRRPWRTGSFGIDYRIIPQTIRDAITVTDGFGMRYVWFDAFCITEDSDEYKVTELVKMGDIYRDAYFTIIASSSPDGSAGFLQDRVLPPHWRVPFYLRDGLPGIERYLSPRKRMYTTDTLRYHCQTSARPVKDSIRAIRTVQSSTLDHAFHPLPQATLAKPDLAELSSEELFVCQCMLRGFVAANYRYTPRSLSRQTDDLKFLAFATIALAAVRRHLGSGMTPRAFVAHASLDTEDDLRPPPAEYLARSRSWAWPSVDGTSSSPRALRTIRGDGSSTPATRWSARSRSWMSGCRTGGHLKMCAAVVRAPGMER